MAVARWLGVLVAGVFFALPARAGSVSAFASMTAGGPTMDVIFITTPNCTGQGATDVLYRAHPFTVTQAGVYHFEVASPGGFASVYLFSPTFDPANGQATCIAADNTGNTVTMDVALTAGTPYIVVPIDDTFTQLGGAYVLSISGPGEIRGKGFSVQAVPTVTTSALGVLVALLASAGFLVLRRRDRPV
ncbi:MAG: hypothetical protein U1F51_20580 [Burkholderiales bacterium]